MSKKSAKLAAAVIGMVAGLTLTASLHAASAADECLTEPKGPAPQGKHWFYHIERGTQRHCWYVRGQDDTAASATVQDQSAATDDEASSTKDQVVAERDEAPPSKSPAKRAAKQIEPPAMRSIADARAELPARARLDNANTAPPPAVAPASPSVPNASVWPDPKAALAAKPVVDTSVSDAETQPDTTTSIAPEPSPSPVTVAQAPLADRALGNRHLGSIPVLLLVAFSALGLAGLTGSTVYRLASARRRARPEDRWVRNVALPPTPSRRRQRYISDRPERIRDNFVEDDFAQDEFEQDQFERHQFERDHFEPEHIAREPVREARSRPEAPRAEAQTTDSNYRREQIEAYLAQLTRQLQADLQATARAE
jgi:hypothetical protein